MCYKRRHSKNAEFNRGQPIRAYVGLGFALLISLAVRPTPHPVVALHSAPHIKKINAQPVVNPPAITPQVAEQPETQPVEEVAATPPPVVYPTDHVALMTSAGISPADYGAVEYIITRESGWNPDATNASSGAHGLPQALPYSKTGCEWSDPICQLTWANQYAVSRYGGWWAAQAYWASHGNW